MRSFFLDLGKNFGAIALLALSGCAFLYCADELLNPKFINYGPKGPPPQWYDPLPMPVRGSILIAGLIGSPFVFLRAGRYLVKNL